MTLGSIYVMTQVWNCPFHEMDKEIIHFTKWTTQLSISWNGQNICPFHEMDKKSTDHFMKWTTKCMKFLLSFTVKKNFFGIFIETLY